jgi:hypothetical protein
MQISLNGKGTSVFDPRPAVYEFLKKKMDGTGHQTRNFIRIGILSIIFLCVKMDAFKGMHGSNLVL